MDVKEKDFYIVFYLTLSIGIGVELAQPTLSQADDAKRALPQMYEQTCSSKKMDEGPIPFQP